MKDLYFDEARHEYTYKGALVPGVTSVIDNILSQFDGVPEHQLKAARERGTAVHRACALYDLDDLVMDSLDPRIVPYLEAWILFRKERGFHPTAIEERVFHPRHMYAGTLDRIGLIGGAVSIVDIKTGTQSLTAGLQSAAYLEARNYRRPDKVRGRVIVHLQPDGKYALRKQTDPSDFSVFLSALHLYTWSKKHGAR